MAGDTRPRAAAAAPEIPGETPRREDYTYTLVVVYHHCMKRLQILMDDDLNEALEREARARDTSKSALLRELVREHLADLPPLDADPVGRMVGADDFEPAPVDEVVYG